MSPLTTLNACAFIAWLNLRVVATCSRCMSVTCQEVVQATHAVAFPLRHAPLPLGNMQNHVHLHVTWLVMLENVTHIAWGTWENGVHKNIKKARRTTVENEKVIARTERKLQRMSHCSWLRMKMMMMKEDNTVYQNIQTLMVTCCDYSW